MLPLHQLEARGGGLGWGVKGKGRGWRVRVRVLLGDWVRVVHVVRVIVHVLDVHELLIQFGQVPFMGREARLGT